MESRFNEILKNIEKCDLSVSELILTFLNCIISQHFISFAQCYRIYSETVNSDCLHVNVQSQVNFLIERKRASIEDLSNPLWSYLISFCAEFRYNSRSVFILLLFQREPGKGTRWSHGAARSLKPARDPRLFVTTLDGSRRIE